MKTRLLLLFVISASIAFMGACQQPAAEAPDYTHLGDAYVSAWNTANVDELDVLLDDDFVRYSSYSITPDRILRGIDEMKEEILETHKFNLNFKVIVEETITHENMLISRWRITAVWARTGKPFEVMGMSILRIRDGKIYEEYNYFDRLFAFRQAGMKLVLEEEE